MDIVTMELFIKNDDRYVANTAKIDKVLQWKRNPYFYGISEDYIRGKLLTCIKAMIKMTNEMRK